jgi:hypothetical protein
MLAEPGYFVPSAGASAALSASPGFFVATQGASVATPAPAGAYVPTSAATAATLASPGHFVATTGASAQTAAPVGSYVATAGASAATLAEPGSYVDTIGATSATLAGLGTFVPTAGSSAALMASPGTYVDSMGATSATQAAPGFFVATAGASAAQEAPPGTYAAFAGSVAATSCPPLTNSYGQANACRITDAAYAGGAPGVTPLLDSAFGTGGSHAIGMLAPDDKLSLELANVSTDSANDRLLTTLTLLEVVFGGDDGAFFELAGFSPGMFADAGTGFALSLRALPTLGSGPFSFTLSLLTDQYADVGTPGQRFTWNFTGTAPGSSGVPLPGTLSLLLAAAGVALLRRIVR